MKGASRTFELPVFVLAFAAVLLAAYLIGGNGLADALGAPRTWLYLTLLATAFLVARGLARSAPRPAAGTLVVALGVVGLLTGGLLGTDLGRAEAKPKPAPMAAGFSAPRLVPQAKPAVDGRDELQGVERSLAAVRSREKAWRARARRAERALEQARARSRTRNRR